MSASDRIHAHLGMNGGLMAEDINGSFDLEADNGSSFVGGNRLSPLGDQMDYPPPMTRQPHRFSVRIGSIAGSRDQRLAMGSTSGTGVRRAGLAPQVAISGLHQQGGIMGGSSQPRSLAASCGGSANNSASQLHEAAASGDLGRVRHLVFEAGVTPDFSDDSGRTPLHCAAMGGQQAVVSLLLQTGCNVDGEDCDGSPPLYYAARYGHVEVVRLLLAHGSPATVDKQNFDSGNTAVHEAAARGFSQTLKLLIHAKANIAIVNKELNTPLHLTAQYGHNQCSRILLYAGAIPESRNNHGDTVLHVAARHGSAGVIRVLLAGVLGGGGSGPVTRGTLGGTNINYAALLSSSNRTGDTPLHLAAAHRHRNIVRLLLDAGCDPSIRNRTGETAVQVASRKGFADISNLLASFMRMPQQSQQNQWMMMPPPTSPGPTASGFPNDGFNWPQPNANQPSAPFFNLVPSTRPGVKPDGSVVRMGTGSVSDPYNNGSGSLRYCHQHQPAGRSADGVVYFDGRQQQQHGRQHIPMGYPGSVAPISYAARPIAPMHQQQQMGGYPQQFPGMFPGDNQTSGVHYLGGGGGSGFDAMSLADGHPMAPASQQPQPTGKKSGKDSTSKQVAFATGKPSSGKSSKSMFSWVERRFDALVNKLSHFKSGSSKSSKLATIVPDDLIPPPPQHQQQMLGGHVMDGRMPYRNGLDPDMVTTNRPPLPPQAFMQQQQMASYRNSQAQYRGNQMQPPFMQQQQQLQQLPQFDQPQPPLQHQQMYRQQQVDQQPPPAQHFYQQQRPQQPAPRLYRTRSDDTLSVSDYKCQTWKKYHRALRAVDDTAFATDAAVRLHQQQIMRMCPAAPRPTSASGSSISSGGSVMSGPIVADRAEQLLAAKRVNRGGSLTKATTSSQGANTISAGSSGHSGSHADPHPPAAFHPTSAASEGSHSGIAPLNSGSTSSNPQSKPNSGNVTAHSSPNDLDSTTKPHVGECNVASEVDDLDIDDHRPRTTDSFKNQREENSPSASANASTPAKIVLSFLKGIASNAAVRRPIADIQPSLAGQLVHQTGSGSVSSSAGAALASGDVEGTENEMIFHQAASVEKYTSKPPSGANSYSAYSAMQLRCSVPVNGLPVPHKVSAGSTTSSNPMCISGTSIGAHESQSPSGASNQSSGYESVKIAAQFLMAAPSRPTATSTPEKNHAPPVRSLQSMQRQHELSPIETPRRCASPVPTDSPSKNPVSKTTPVQAKQRTAVLTKSPCKTDSNFGVVVFANPMIPTVSSPAATPTKHDKSREFVEKIEEEEDEQVAELEEQENKKATSEEIRSLPILPRPVAAPVPTSFTMFGRYGSSCPASVFSDNQCRALSYQRIQSGASAPASTTNSHQSSPVRSLLQTATSTNPYATVRAPVRHLNFDPNTVDKLSEQVTKTLAAGVITSEV